MDGASAANRQNVNNSNAIFYVSFGVCLLLYLSTYLIGSNDVADQAIPASGPPAPPIDAPPPPPVIKRRVAPPKPPTTPAAYQLTHILPAMLDDYVISAGGCWPTDIDNEAKHRPPPPRAASGRQPEPKSVMVVYVAVALLLMSLGATLVDFCKAKSELTNANDLHASRKRPALTRRCSLADLTVLRHTRKELLRKESFCAAGDRDWKITRPPLRLD